MNRRSFLTAAAAATVGYATPSRASIRPGDPLSAPNEYELGLADADLSLLGWPRSWTLVRDGFHPISPERVVIIRQHDLGPQDEHTSFKAELWADSEKRCNWCRGRPFSDAKMDLTLKLFSLLAGYYGQHHFESWARRSVGRETLGDTGLADGLAIPHDFQPFDKPVQTVNGFVDWWLFLCPDGAPWECVDGELSYLMVIPVFEDRGGQPGTYLRTLGLAYRVLQSIRRNGDGVTRAKELAQLDRLSAARTFNLQVARELNGVDAG